MALHIDVVVPWRASTAAAVKVVVIVAPGFFELRRILSSTLLGLGYVIL